MSEETKEVTLSLVNAPQSPNLSPEFNFRMLALSKTRWSKHEDKSEILGSACHCRQI